MLLSDDWEGADFIAQRIDGEQLLKVQLKSRFAIAQKYMGKNIYVCFHHKVWYMYPHDRPVTWALKNTNIGNTYSWQHQKHYSVPVPLQKLASYLEKYKLESSAYPFVQADARKEPARRLTRALGVIDASC